VNAIKIKLLIVAATIAFVLSLGLGPLQPSGANARSSSFTCTTLEAMFETADAAGMSGTSLYLQHIYLSLDCNTIDMTGDAA
jgi:hypothetical protein